MKKFKDLKVGEYFVYDSMIYIKTSKSSGIRIKFYEEFHQDNWVKPVSIESSELPEDVEFQMNE